MLDGTQIVRRCINRVCASVTVIQQFQVSVDYFSNGFFSIFPGGFLSDAGWYTDSEKVYQSCLRLCHSDTTVPSLCRSLECSVK